MSEKYFEIMNRYIDGLASEEEIAELKEYIKSDPESSRMCKDLFQIDKAIKSIPDVPPPADLKSNILKSINISGQRAMAKESTFKNYIISLRENIRTKYTYSVAMGVAAGICFIMIGAYYLDQNQHLDNNYYSGTLLVENEFDRFVEVASDAFDMSQSAGSVTVKIDNGQCLLRIDIQSDIQVLIRIEHENNMTLERSYSQVVQSGENFRISEGIIEIAHSGNNSYYLVLEKTKQVSSQLGYKIISGQEVYNNKLIIE